MELTPVTVTLIILLIILSISIIYFNLKINEKFVAPDVPDYDLIGENCISYVTNVKGWNLDYGIPEPTNQKEIKAKEEKIRRRAEIISLFSTMKSPTYSIFGQQYTYSDACAMPKSNILSINMNEGDCSLNGNFIRESEDDDGTASIAEIVDYRKKYVVPDGIRLYTPELFRNATALNELDMRPNKGCIVTLSNQELFFNMIDRIAAMRYFDNDNKNRIIEEDRVKAIKEKIQAIEERRIAIGERNVAIEQRIFAENERQRVEIERNVALAQIEQDRIIIDNANNQIRNLQSVIEQDAATLANTRADYDRRINELNNIINNTQNALNEKIRLEQQLRQKIIDLTVKPKVFRDTDFRGASLELDEGEYHEDYLQQRGFNNSISSVIVPKDYKVIVFKDPGFRGRSAELTLPVCKFGKHLQDRISSIKVVKLNKV